MLVNLGYYIKNQRLEKGLSRQGLAAMLGYNNVNKGARRIENAEVHGKFMEGLLDRLCEVLELDLELINQAIQKDRENFEEWLNQPVKQELIIRLMPAIYSRHELPGNIQTDEEAIAYAKSVARQYKRKVCLCLNRRWTYWIQPDGSYICEETTFESPINHPYMQIKGDNKKFLLSFNDQGRH